MPLDQVFFKQLQKDFKEMKWLLDEEPRPQKQEDKYCKDGMSPYDRVSSPSHFTDITDEDKEKIQEDESDVVDFIAKNV